MNCYTYYEKMQFPKNQEELVDLCSFSWRNNGWNFNVLSTCHARSHPFFEEYNENIIKLPSSNSSFYEYGCFMRWLAMANVGGGVMIDYDVVNLGFRDFFDHYDKNFITILQNDVPCVVYGTADQYLNICKKFCEIKHKPESMICIFDKKGNSKLHTSDMIMLRNIECNKKSIVAYYPEIHSKLIHCSEHQCFNNNISKKDAMLDLIKNYYYPLAN